MRNFTGEVGKRKVALGGRSRTAEETREEVLERTRLERERRRQAKLEQQSAVLIQKHWQRWWSVRQTQAALRQQWIQQYGDQGEKLSRADLQVDQPCIPSLLLFSCTRTSQICSRQPHQALVADLQRLAALSRTLLSVAQQPGGLAALSPTMRPTNHQRQHASGATVLGMQDMANGNGSVLHNAASSHAACLQQMQAAHATLSPVSHTVYTLARLAEHCLNAISILNACDKQQIQQVLGSQRPSIQQPLLLPPTAVLAEVLLLLVSPDSWGWVSAAAGQLAGSTPSTTGSSWTAAAAAAAVTSQLALGYARTPPATSNNTRTTHFSCTGLFRTLGQVLCTTTQQQQPPGSSSRSYAELLVTQLCVRALALKVPGIGSSALELQPSNNGMQLLLCVPNLWSCCPSLGPVAKHITRLAAGSLAAVPPNHFSRRPHAYLLSESDGAVLGTAGAAMAALNNLVQGGLKLLTPPADGHQAATTQDANYVAALRLCRALNILLCVLPTAVMRQASSRNPTSWSVMSDDAEAEEQLVELDAALYRSSASSAVQAAQQDSTGYGDEIPPRLAIPSDEMLPSDLLRGVQVLTDTQGRQLLRLLVFNLLPISSSSDAVATQSGLDYMQGSLQLCRLINQLGSLWSNRQHLYIALALSMEFVPRLWWSTLRPYLFFSKADTKQTASQSPSQQLPASPTSAMAKGVYASLAPGDDTALLQLLCAVFAAHMAVTNVEEFFAGQPLPLTQLYDPAQPSAGLVYMLKDRLWFLLWRQDANNDSNTPTAKAEPFKLQPAASSNSKAQLPVTVMSARLSAVQRRVFLETAGALYAALYDRSSGGGGAGRRQFCSPAVFHASTLGPERFAQEAAAARISAQDFMQVDSNGTAGLPTAARMPASRNDLGARIWQVLCYAPALVPFEERARLFQAEAASARREFRESEERSMQEAALLGHFQPPRFITIRRSQILWDGFDKITALGPDALKGRVRISYTDDEGIQEAGVDGGGLFKDFLEGIMKEGFGSTSSLFNTNAESELYPNPAAPGVVPEATQLLTFLGRMLGKAMWEGILLELPLARFFLKKLRGGRCDLRDLASLDQQLYNNLVSLKSYKGELSDLSLTFTVTREVFGSHEEIELRPGGSAIMVTADNVGEYIARVADFRLNVEPARACNAFIHGFHELVQPEWVGLFNESELQMLISGRSEEAHGGGLDLLDLQRHTHYAGGYHEDHPVVHVLWQALATFTASEQHNFLKFVTACSRAPLLGFKYLEPQLCIHMAGSMLDDETKLRLPTAATCINLLKLPPYRTVEAMREKLLLAVAGAHTFDLT